MGKKSALRVKQVGPKHAPSPSQLVNPMESLMVPSEELAQLKLPDRPSDRNYKVYWPLHQTFSMDTTKFQCIYPSYLDSTKSIKFGRRIPSHLAVPRPTLSDLSSALQLLSVRHVVQPYKGYSRDPTTLWDNPGRLLVDVSQYNKSSLLKLMAARIPTLSTRLERLRFQEHEEAEYERQKAEYVASQAQSQTASSSTGTTKASSKKKGGKHGGKHRK